MPVSGALGVNAFSSGVARGGGLQFTPTAEAGGGGGDAKTWFSLG